MIEPFSFTPFPEIFFGSGEFLKLPGRLIGKAHSVLLVCGGNSLQQNGYLKKFIDELQEKNISHHSVNITSEPTPKMIDRIVNEPKSKSSDYVIAIGGGSVLDAGKAIAAMIPLEDGITHYLEGVGDRSHPGDTLPFIAVPTTAGTGSEATKNAVITSIGAKGFKKSLRHNNFIPTMAVIDPELMLSCPQPLTAACGLDAFTQLFESYVSSKANPITDALSLDALSKVIRSFPAAVNSGQDNVNARADMAYGALISGITLANAGLGVVHGFASVIGGFFDIPHGVVCGTLLPAATEVNIHKLQCKSDDIHVGRLEKHIKVARLFPGSINLSDVSALKHMVQKLYEWADSFKIPTLGHFGIKEDDFERIIEGTGQKNNPVKLNKEDLLRILEIRL